MNQSPQGEKQIVFPCLEARVYRPPAARVDTVLFPAFRSVIGDPAYHERCEEFEELEHSRFGERGFEDGVAGVTRVEGVIGIDDLARITAP
jgi:hypothetical protein